MNNTTKSFDILTISFEYPTQLFFNKIIFSLVKLFSNLYLLKFLTKIILDILDILAKTFFSVCTCTSLLLYIIILIHNG